MSDAGSISGAELIEALARCVQITMSDPIIREFLDRNDPKYVRQAQTALELEAAMREAKIAVIANFDDTPDDAILNAIHEAYQDWDLAHEDDTDDE